MSGSTAASLWAAHDHAERDRRGAGASGFCCGFRQAEGLPEDEGEKRRVVAHVDDADRLSRQAIEDEGAGKEEHPKQRDTAVDENARQRRRRRREPGGRRAQSVLELT